MPENYILLERTELNASAASVTFANIPQSGYTDLKIVTSLRGTVNLGSGYVDGILTFNGTTTGYSERMVYGLGGSAGSVSQSSTGIKWGNWANDTSTTANTFGNCETYIPNYTSSNYKSVSVDGVQENNASGSAIAALNAGLWSNTAAITSITLTAGSGSFAQYSTFSLYGIAAVGTTPAIAPKASGGNIIDYDGTYWIHTFTSSGTFTPQTGLTCDYLVVAGGGAGGAFRGGGGGAGGYRTSVGTSGRGASAETALTLNPSTNYTVTIGAGGAKVSTDNPSNNGNNSVFATVTSTGGGAGGNASGTASNGGAGGGAQGNNVTSGTHSAGTGTTAQGYDGGTASGSVSPFGGGGGGGAGSAGGNASGAAASGGTGVTSSISGSSITYAAGGNGGATLAGAGGDGTTNCGNGGCGGGDTSATNGNGGSGIVIIRYPAA